MGDAFAAEWRSAHPGCAYTHRDLTADPVPLVDAARTELAAQSSATGVRALAAMAPLARTHEQRTAWEVSRTLIEEVLAADVLLIATPMYNYSVPAALKAWIDQISFPWLPLAGRQVVVATGRGGSYASGTPRARLDLQEPYLRAYFETFGVERIEFVHAELSNAPIVPFLAQFADDHVRSVDLALTTARTLARTLPSAAR